VSRSSSDHPDLYTDVGGTTLNNLLTTTSLTDTGLKANTTYYYIVTAYIKYGDNWSVSTSLPVSATTLP